MSDDPLRQRGRSAEVSAAVLSEQARENSGGAEVRGFRGILVLGVVLSALFACAIAAAAQVAASAAKPPVFGVYHGHATYHRLLTAEAGYPGGEVNLSGPVTMHLTRTDMTFSMTLVGNVTQLVASTGCQIASGPPTQFSAHGKVTDDQVTALTRHTYSVRFYLDGAATVTQTCYGGASQPVTHNLGYQFDPITFNSDDFLGKTFKVDGLIFSLSKH